MFGSIGAASRDSTALPRFTSRLPAMNTHGLENKCQHEKPPPHLFDDPQSVCRLRYMPSSPGLSFAGHHGTTRKSKDLVRLVFGQHREQFDRLGILMAKNGK